MDAEKILNEELELYKKSYKREKQARLQAEYLLEDKTRDLYKVNNLLNAQCIELTKHIAESGVFLSISRFAQSTFSFKTAMQFFIDTVCNLGNWPVGHVYIPDQENEGILVSSGIWHLKDVDLYNALVTVTSQKVFKKGEGLPGRIWATGSFANINKIEDDTNYPRAPLCKQVGLRGTFGIPIKIYDQIVGIAEFFSIGELNVNGEDYKLIEVFAQQFETILSKKKAEQDSDSNNLKLNQALNVLQQLEHYDPLTKLSNRRHFESTLKEEIKLAKRYNHQFAVFYIGLDYFKIVNDRLGYRIGDMLLTTVAQRLKESIRQEDFIARLGGDEFVFIGKIKDYSVIDFLANKIISALNKPYNINGNDILISASIGIACYPKDGLSTVTICKHADIALYNVKQHGRKNFTHFNDQMKQERNRSFEIESMLNFAIDQEQLFLVYQPIFSLSTREMVTMEVLVRWRHPVLGLVPPDEFIPIAEEKGFMPVIGEWILRTACKQFVRWVEAYSCRALMFVNISACQLKDKNFSELVLKILQETKMPTNQLGIEITETAIMSESDENEIALSALHNLGIKIAIDDFGTGYSSLSRLKKLPFSTLKIDKSFVSDIGSKNNNDLIIRSIIMMAESLGIDVVAEGVEEEAQIEFLMEQKCHKVQGYFFSMPLSVDDMTRLLADKKS